MTLPLDRRQLALIGAGYALSAVAFPWLTPYATDNPWSLVGVALIVAILPLAAFVNYLVFQRIGRNGSTDEDVSSMLAIREIGFRLTLFKIALHVLILANLAPGFELRSIVPARLVVVLFGVLLIGIGDLLPRTRPNLAVGIRTSATLANRDFWIRLHRVAGYAAVAFGAVIVVAGAFLRNPTMPQVISIAGWTTVAIIVATYRRYLPVETATS
jgi:hypothetical protein